MLLLLAADPDDELAWMGVRLLGRLRDPAHQPVFLAPIGDAARRPSAAAAAADAFAAMDVVEAAGALAAMLTDPSVRPFWPRAAAARALGRLGRADVPASVAALAVALRGCPAAAGGSRGTRRTRPGSSYLVSTRLDDADEITRARAAAALGRLRPPDGSSPGEAVARRLISAAGDPVPRMRATAVTALGRWGRAADVPVLRSALDDRIRACGRRRPPQCPG